MVGRRPCNQRTLAFQGAFGRGRREASRYTARDHGDRRMRHGATRPIPFSGVVDLLLLPRAGQILDRHTVRDVE